MILTLTLGSSAFAAAVCYRLPFSNPDLADGWGSLMGRASPHRGVDFPQAAGTPIPAVADGVVRLVTSSSCLGNVVVIEHGDGMFSGYSHLVARSPLTPGASIAMGQIIGNVGTTGTCSTGPHLHLTMAPTLGGYASGTTVDPYVFIQNHKDCGCDRAAGGVTFSCDGANAGKTCVSINEPADPDSWADNFLCTDSDIGLKWSSSGPIPGMRCTNVTETSDSHAAAWADNYACVPSDSEFVLSWSSAGALPGQSCVQFNEVADPQSWGDNFLCVAPTHEFSAGGFTFSGAGPTATGVCVNVDEPSDPDTWTDNFFCSAVDVGMKWSHGGTIAGMRCTNVTESADKSATAWADNFLCVPQDAPYTFTWSPAGRLPNQDCVRWYEAAEVGGSWGDNYLCVTALAKMPGADGGTEGAGGGGWVDGGVGGSSPGYQPDGNNASADEASGCSVRAAPSPSYGLAPLAFFTAVGALVRRRRRASAA